MKKLLLGFAACALLGLTANAQISRPSSASIFGTTYPVTIEGIVTSNIPPAIAPSIPVGPLGFGVSLVLGGTNATTTTNAVFIFEAMADVTGTNGATAVTFNVIAPQTGVTAYYYWTNIVGTAANVGNLRGVRLKSIQNTNTASLFITNAEVLTR